MENVNTAMKMDSIKVQFADNRKKFNIENKNGLKWSEIVVWQVTVDWVSTTQILYIEEKRDLTQPP